MQIPPPELPAVQDVNEELMMKADAIIQINTAPPEYPVDDEQLSNTQCRMRMTDSALAPFRDSQYNAPP